MMVLILNEKPKKVISHEVIVVPIFAPNTNPTESATLIRPAFTKPMIITVAADDDCKTDVTANPVNKPFQGLEVMADKY